MSISRTGIFVALALTAAGAASASAQSGRYATDPNPFIYNQLGYEHRSLSHSDAVLPRTSSRVVAARAATNSGYAYATDPNPFIYNQLGYEHRSLSHSDAVLPRSSRAQIVATSRASAAPVFSGRWDPDPRIRSQLAREAPSKLW